VSPGSYTWRHAWLGGWRSNEAGNSVVRARLEHDSGARARVGTLGCSRTCSGLGNGGSSLCGSWTQGAAVGSASGPDVVMAPCSRWCAGACFLVPELLIQVQGSTMVSLSYYVPAQASTSSLVGVVDRLGLLVGDPLGVVLGEPLGLALGLVGMGGTLVSLNW
jgi:hypothetical protein